MPFRRLGRSERALALAAEFAGFSLAFSFRTVRWRLVVAPEAERVLDDGNAVLAFWHEFLPSMPMLWRLGAPRYAGARRAHVLISRHRDGRAIAAVVRRFGLDVIEGSSGRRKNGVWTDRGGGGAFKRMEAVLAQGDYVAITPDGPRGPRRRAAGGAASLARAAGRPLLPCAAVTEPAIRLPSWDRMALPCPWGRGVVLVGAPVAGGGDGADDDARLGQALDAAADAAAAALGGRA